MHTVLGGMWKMQRLRNLLIGGDTISSGEQWNELQSQWLRANEQLERLRALEPDWDGEGAEVPNRDLFNNINDWLSKLAGNDYVPPSRLTASQDGTVVLEWHQDQEYTEVEFLEPNHAEWMQRLPDGRYKHGLLFEQQKKYETISAVETEPVHIHAVDTTMNGTPYRENKERDYPFYNEPALTSADYLYGT